MRVLLEVLIGLLAMWLVMVLVLALRRPSAGLVAESLRLLPDLLRLVSRLARDPLVPASVRLRLWLLLGYLASPVDLVPDFVPVLGYADDAILVALVLRSVVRRAGVDAVDRAWPGTPDGFALVHQLCNSVDHDR